jgi:hypothetical protein
MSFNNPCQLSDAELEAEVLQYARRAREATAHLVALLAELDARQLHLAAGFSSLFGYCTQSLGLSDHESYNRIEAARAARAFPLILDLLHDGAVNLTTVRLLAPHLTEENHRKLLAAASGLRKRELEELLARHFPKPDVASAIRKLPVARTAPAPRAASEPAVARAAAGVTGAPPSPKPHHSRAPAEDVETESVFASPPPGLPAVRNGPRPLVAPLSQDRYVVKFTASAATRDKLRQAQDLLRHVIPNGDVAEVIDRALTVLVDQLARRKFGATDRPRKARPTTPGSRHVPAEVRRGANNSHDGRCGFVGSDGRRCSERGFIEFHHIWPYGEGGEATPGNIELRCRAHNAYEARLHYGPIHELAAAEPVREPVAGYGHAPGARELVLERVAVRGRVPAIRAGRTNGRGVLHPADTCARAVMRAIIDSGAELP